MKTKHGSAIKKIKPKMGFFSSLFGPGQSSATKYGPPLCSQPVIGEPGYLEVDQSSVELSIFTADVDVKLSPKVSVEIRRSTKKNPPRVLKYELIYVCLPPTSVTKDVNICLTDRERRVRCERARR